MKYLNRLLIFPLEFADALSNPMKYLSEQDKRAEQMKALMDNEEKDRDVDEPSPTLVRILHYH